MVTLCGDLFARVGRGAAATTDDIVEPAMAGEAMFRSTSLAPDTTVTLHRLAGLEPSTLAVMHGSSFTGDGGAALRALAGAYGAHYLAGV